MRKSFMLNIGIFFVMLMGVGAMAGCSGDRVKLDAKNPVTVTIWHYYHGTQKTAFDEMVKDFNETEGYSQGIIIEATSYGGASQLAENVLAAAAGELDAGAMPNIFGSYGDTALDIYNKGLAAEIDSYLSEDDLKDYEPSFLREGRLGMDHLYVLPVAKSSDSLMINKTDFDAFINTYNAGGTSASLDIGALSTWEGILETAEVYYQHTGKAFMGIDYVANYLIIGSKQLGQDIVRVEDGKPILSLDEDIMLTLWQTYYDPMVTGRFTKLGRFCSDDIKTGDSLCYVGSTASAGYFPTELTLNENNTHPVEMVVLPMPVFENGQKFCVSQGAGMAIAKSTKEKEYAAAIFLKWFTEPERNVSFSLEAGYLPVTRTALKNEFLDPVFANIDTGDAIAVNTVKALTVGIEQLRDYTFYTNDVFDGGADFRNQLSEPLVNAAQEGRELYMQMLAEGQSPEQASSVVRDNGLVKFNEWIESLRQLYQL